MSFRRWRQQFQVMFALERLAEGHSVQTVAFDLGYESASAFITMFKGVLGKPPANFLASRRLNGAGRHSRGEYTGSNPVESDRRSPHSSIGQKNDRT